MPSCANIEAAQAKPKSNELSQLQVSLPNPAIVTNAKPDADGWLLRFNDKGETPWQDNWFVDGRFSKVTNTQKGLKN